jgi:hypothetical protein
MTGRSSLHHAGRINCEYHFMRSCRACKTVLEPLFCTSIAALPVLLLVQSAHVQPILAVGLGLQWSLQTKGAMSLASQSQCKLPNITLMERQTS